MRTDLIVVDREIHSGAPVFRGTRVPVKTLFGFYPVSTDGN